MLDRLRLTDVRRLAGLRVFRRGETAYEQGFVTRTARRGQVLQGEVRDHGGTAYRVEVRVADGDIRPHCNCPRVEETCEHVVALLLWWLEEGREAKAPRERLGVEDVERALRGRSKQGLVDLLMGFALRDDGIMNALTLEAARTSRKPLDVGRYRRMVRNALSSRFVDYYHTGDYLRNLEALRDDLDRLREAGRGAEAHACLVYFLEKALDRYREIEDADLRFYDILLRVVGSWGAALAEARLAPGDAAEEVLRLVEPADASFLDPIVRAAAPGLRAQGLRALERLGQERLAAAGSLGSGFPRRKIRALLLAVTRETGDDERHLALLREELESSSDHLLAAEKLLALGKVEEAATVARDGLRASPSRDPRLIAFQSRLAERSGDLPGALALALEVAHAQTSLEALERVASLARRAGTWDQTRGLLLRSLRQDPSPAVVLEFLLEEGLFTEILALARRGRLPEALLERVARRAEASHPDEARAIWRGLVESHASRKTADADRHAAHALRALAALERRSGRTAPLETYLSALLARVKRRPALVEALRAAAGAA